MGVSFGRDVVTVYMAAIGWVLRRAISFSLAASTTTVDALRFSEITVKGRQQIRQYDKGVVTRAVSAPRRRETPS